MMRRAQRSTLFPYTSVCRAELGEDDGDGCGGDEWWAVGVGMGRGSGDGMWSGLVVMGVVGGGFHWIEWLSWERMVGVVVVAGVVVVVVAVAGIVVAVGAGVGGDVVLVVVEHAFEDEHGQDAGGHPERDGPGIGVEQCVG